MTNCVETILDEVGARLANITEANEYSVTIAKITRAKMTPFKNGDLPALNYWAEELTIDRTAYNYDACTLPVVVESVSKTRDLPFTDVAYDLANQILTAVNRATIAPAVSDTPSLNLGNIVNQFAITSIVPIIGEGEAPFTGVIVYFKATFYTAKNDISAIIHPDI